ncbi:MAG: hypothetical protein R3F15_17385 [Lysobacterales bacterium]
MIWRTIRAFLYGFVLFGGILWITDLAYSPAPPDEPIWGAKHTLTLASVGGAMFAFSWCCLFLAWKIITELVRADVDT